MVSVSKIVVRYAETDQMGIAHHSNYPVWYEVARTDLIKKIGLTYSEMERMGVMTPLVELHCRYIGVCRYEDELLVEACVEELAPARVKFRYQIFRSGEEKPIHTGYTLHAWVDSQTFRPVSLKKRYPDLYQKIGNSIEK